MEKSATSIGDLLASGAKGIGGVVAKYPAQSAVVGGAGAIAAAILLANKAMGLSDLYYNHSNLSVAKKQKEDLDKIVSILQPGQPVHQEEPQQLILPRLT